MDKNKIEKYVQRSKEVLESSPQLDEANTKKKIIEPLLELLDWDSLSSDITLEYTVQMGSTNKNVDYALIVNDNPVVFVEAKGASNKIGKKDIRQLKSYMKQEDVKFGLISNGRKWKIMQMKWKDNRTEVIGLKSFELQKVLDKFNIVRMISKDSIKSGESETIAKNIEKSQKAVQNLKSNKEDLTEKITDIIRSEIGEYSSEKIKTESAKFLERLIDNLGEPVKKKVEKENKKIPELSRKDLKSYEDGEVIICPSAQEGINFLMQYNAWGFIKIGKKPKYLSIYVKSPKSEVIYFAEVDKIVDPKSRECPVPDPESYDHYGQGKKVILLEEGSLKKLKDPIPLGSESKYAFQGHRYTKLEKFLTAETTDALF